MTGFSGYLQSVEIVVRPVQDVLCYCVTSAQFLFDPVTSSADSLKSCFRPDCSGWNTHFHIVHLIFVREAQSGRPKAYWSLIDLVACYARYCNH